MTVVIGRISVLVAEGDMETRVQLATTLANTGYDFDIRVASDGNAALALIKAINFDIVFIDKLIGGLGCRELLSAIKLMRRRSISIVLSENITPDEVEQFSALGAYDSQRKPINEAEIREFIARCLIIRIPHCMLLLDQSSKVRDVIKKVIERSIFNVRITEVGTGHELIEAIKSQFFRIIIADPNVPDMSIYDLSRRWSQCERVSSVIFTATETNQKLDEAAKWVGAIAFLQKPFHPVNVDAVLHHVFDLPPNRFGRQVSLYEQPAEKKLA